MQIISDDSQHDGLTVRQLRHLIGQVEESDGDGNDAMVFLAVGNLHVSVAITAAVDDDGDLILISDHAQAVMEDLGTWEGFISAS